MQEQQSCLNPCRSATRPPPAGSHYRLDPKAISFGVCCPSCARTCWAYLPFGAGPRLCIGNQFALTEAQLVLASIAQRYQLRLLPGHPVRPNPIFTLRTSHGLPMTAQRRS
jgi:cytochrome P450